MGKLKIVVSNKTKDSITRTIRMSGDTYDRINEIADKNNISFNNVVNQILEYGLENIESEEK
jgi:predicted DNA-binding protein